MESATKARKILGNSAVLTALRDALNSLGGNQVETFEQRTVRRWLQGKE